MHDRKTQISNKVGAFGSVVYNAPHLNPRVEEDSKQILSTCQVS